ncbi:MAG: NADPH-dependent 7-cyano-7-deazaguanine reductase QueF [Rhodoferax sp.]|uniref:NADPH-dependent 7-cyano-7-deazaguanine reductase QueF n=1 Tax=Rhodoferax sp. TaxID=50421 RepID=UPI0008D48C65|nr:NADPH-dependent 7-cyano-7-deazaguanine reductase QueF [Rhodoferax sp.]MDP2677260.1 NADPH-dependent 7-cyano-7-deazaguanine reductase QueF [Rhodoferax sp.]OGB52015.1 MAG: NADPH-dependent 7-cyano-7-deazaguanine reductase QueF [Burkholderiales bacterium RIFOXYD12_FULL_59_19]
MTFSSHSPLGKPTFYADQYNASLLFPIARAPQRAELGLAVSLPFLGADLWTAFELSWLNARGKPQVALAHITVPCESVNLIESKSLKLYLGSFNNTRFTDAAEVLARLRTDLTEVAWRGAVVQSSVGVKLVAAELFDREPIEALDGLSLDRLDLDCDRYTPAPELLSSATLEAPVSEVLTSNLLRSNCPVTGQPDWGSVQISYFGPQIDQAGLLRYIISFRNHQGFHEHCVERMFMDIQARCQPHKLAVYARYTRRGGLDINPFRTSYPQALPANHRNARQ